MSGAKNLNTPINNVNQYDFSNSIYNTLNQSGARSSIQQINQPSSTIEQSGIQRGNVISSFD